MDRAAGETQAALTDRRRPAVRRIDRADPDSRSSAIGVRPSQTYPCRMSSRRFMAALCGLIAACQVTIDGAHDNPPLHVENGTELAVSVLVNGQLVDEYPAMASGEVDADLPPLPWRVEARSASGRILTSFDVALGDVRTDRGPQNEITHGSAMLGRVDLSCGRLSVWAGDITPMGPAPGPNPGRPGDCEP